ncbi:hypothetical protein CC86DRAFT_413274 [Ophiobolus disseminans]|uniref:F-box domain-containing protein n=1 Tax=Ophiobolus disseminans TaxID=1469910 RepID=A0A6A6ZET1_9PLEO|nr:hypothetical protein CC86DRAFT_413274 [Ophiobolus disseminans]
MPSSRTARRSARQPECDVGTAKPFRLLDLPKELRLMIYEQLTVEWNHQSVPLTDKGDLYSITVINPSLPGIRILATCNFINSEGYPILAPRLAQMITPPPTLIIEAQHLVGVTNMRNCVVHKRSFVDKLLAAIRLRPIVPKIHLYRESKLGVGSLRIYLDLKRYVPDAAVTAVATFVLRAQTIWSADKTPNNHPPMTIAVSVPTGFSSIPVMLTSSRAYRFISNRFLNQNLQRTRLVQFTTPLLVRRLAGQMLWTSEMWKARTVSMMLYFPDGSEEYTEKEQLEVDFEGAIEVAILAYHQGSGPPALGYGGVFEVGEDGRPK